MSRTSRVPYHQNLSDLLQLPPHESPEAARRIAAHEARHGRLPAAVREFYLIPNIVPLTARRGVPRRPVGKGSIWYRFSNMEQVPPLSVVLRRFARTAGVTGRFVQVLCENQGAVRWWLERDGSDDPPVWVDNDIPDDPSQWSVDSPTFSAFVFTWFAHFGFHPDWGLIREPDVPDLLGLPATQATAHANGLWLRSPAEPFAPPVIDFLTEQLGEPERTHRPGDVTTYTFRPTGGTIRVTADDPSLTGGLSAWWVHAESPERLAELGRLLLPWGTLRETLRADTDGAHAVRAALS